MVELDFYTFGAPRNQERLDKFKAVLDEIEASEDSDDLYYGDKTEPEVVAFNFLWFYYRCRSKSEAVMMFFQCTGFKNHLEAVSAVRAEIEARADSSAVCSAAMEILGEYETFTFHWEKTHEHRALQRAIMKRQRKKFYEAVAARDGEFCGKCGSTEKLQLDHIEAVLFGGLTVLENLQLLCAKCNNEERWASNDYRTKSGSPGVRHPRLPWRERSDQ